MCAVVLVHTSRLAEVDVCHIVLYTHQNWLMMFQIEFLSFFKSCLTACMLRVYKQDRSIISISFLCVWVWGVVGGNG